MFMGVDTLDTLEVDVDTLDSLLETNYYCHMFMGDKYEDMYV